MRISATRYHDISCGHRVLGHEGACAKIHGHNYRIHFTVEPHGELDPVGRVVDFSVIKDKLCHWLDRHWDHKFLADAKDPIVGVLQAAGETVVPLSFNPTAENMAQFLVEVVGPSVLPCNVVLVAVQVDETRKCSARYEIARGIR